ncbi:aromatic ring-hydroxylating oxygenase subunit alpha [Hyphomonas johnsonii]|uniref:Rieske (2Fe-2S) domain-containing protein n=1 Tax=Hyphomonas johnsonii MHS-2 TaxID=1280950 RepID=A0A059FNK6_9PROT|nr:aromatic ring-hydroxylating dioxygenase subunit alpha [Hyphomonas johnsonii]KCZ92096.1 Rieske (2Fe-2S) domain-containing protein [Hyphomonas johnsonii MHS-2]
MTRELPGISTAEIDRAARPLAQAMTLPPAAYIREDVFGLEVERIFRRRWLPLARVDQVAKPGDFLSMDVFGQPVMIVHGQDGEIRVMSRTCLHRAAQVVEGNGNRKLFTCPYHAWSYDTAGQLVRAPLMEGAEGFSESGCRLPQVRTEIWQGFILANFDPDAAPFAPQARTFETYFEKFRLEDMVVVRTLEYDSDWNWKVLVENFMEAYHHIGVHPETFEPAYHARDSRVPDNDGPWSILHMPAAHEEVPLGLPPVEGLEDWQVRDLFASVLYPHFLLGVQGSVVTWYQVFPEAAGKMKLKIHICVPGAYTGFEGFDQIADEISRMVAAIHDEDIGANHTVWKGLNAPLTRQGRLSPLEKAIWQFNTWWLETMVPEGDTG